MFPDAVVRWTAPGARSAVRRRGGRSIALLGVVVLHGAVGLLLALAPVRARVMAPDPVLVNLAVEPPVDARPEQRTPLVPVRLVPVTPSVLPLPEIELPPEPPLLRQQTSAEPPAMSAPSVALATTTVDLTVSCPVRVPPQYPREARRRRVQGTVVLRVQIDETGRIDEVSVEQSAGSRELDEAGMAAVRQWRCLPALREGHPQRAVALQSLEFVLTRR